MNRSIRIAGQEIYYQEIGFGKRISLLAHGFGNNGHMWLPFILPHLRSTKFLLVDLPGFGQSRKAHIFSDDSLSAHTEALRAILEQSAAEEVKMVGFSLGAYACLNLLGSGNHVPIISYMHIDHPPLVKNRETWSGGIDHLLMAEFQKLCEVADQYTFPKSNEDILPPNLASQYERVLFSLGDTCLNGGLLRALNRLVYSNSLTRTWLVKKISLEWSLRIFRDYYLGANDLRGLLSNIRTPVQLVAGAKSRICNAEALAFMASELPTNQVKLFKGGHDFMISEFSNFSKFFGKFINE